MREKLIELLINADLGCIKTQCHSCGHYDSPKKPNGIPGCVECRVADHLIQNGVTIQKWIPVTERLPDENVPGCKYLCYWNGHIRVCNYSRTRKVFDFNGRITKVTHWMPLPEPPKEVE